MTAKYRFLFLLFLSALILAACGGTAGSGSSEDAVGVVYRSPT